MNHALSLPRSIRRVMSVGSLVVGLTLLASAASAESLTTPSPDAISATPQGPDSGAPGAASPSAAVVGSGAASSVADPSQAGPSRSANPTGDPTSAPDTSPAPTTTTLVLSDTGPTPAPANIRATVAVTVGDVPVSGGTVRFLVDGAVVGAAVPVVAGIASRDLVEDAPGSHKVTAEFSGAVVEGAAYAASTAPATVLEVDRGDDCEGRDGAQGSVGTSTSDDDCDDEHGDDKDQPRVLAISTPYTDTNPLEVPPMVLQRDSDCVGNPYQYQSDAPFSGISVKDSRKGRNAWTVSALSGEFGLLGVPPALRTSTERINPQNVGLTNLAITSTTAVPESIAPPRPAGSQPLPLPVNFTVFDNPSAAHLLSEVPGSLGLGGTAKRAIHANRGFGTSLLVGTMSITAPVTTSPGVYKGVVTFTLIGS